MSEPDAPIHLFEGFGVEIEYMIVDEAGLDVLPICDEVLRSIAGEYVSEVELGDLAWSNELVLHVIELKTNGPAPSLSGLADAFQEQVGAIERILSTHRGRLMSTAMHPWMDPATDTRLWPHEYSPVYTAFDRIFGCSGHGWSNLQSTHINLPFANDDEFGRLHAAIRLVLPILPGLAASSPVVDGRLSGMLDTRLSVYRRNARRVPSVSGDVIPEVVSSRAEYESEILERMYRDIAPYDPEGILRHEWLNARGAIARFDRGAIEIRLLDVQECPRADLAVAALVVAAVEALASGRWSDRVAQDRLEVAPLAAILDAATTAAEDAVIDNPAYLEAFGHAGRRATVGELWRHIAGETLCAPDVAGSEWDDALRAVLDRGTLARRIASALGGEPSRQRLADVYRRLCDCLRGGELFNGV